VRDHEDPTDRLALGGIPVAVYVAMFGATLGGQLAGMALDALVVGRRVLWVPAACSVLLEALAGARFAAARLGHPLAPAQCARLSAYYSAVLAAIGLPLWGWTLVARAPGGSVAPGRALAVLALVVAALAAATVVRFALMVLFSPRPAQAGPGRTAPS
jgi:hypothetical protein